MSKSTGSRTSSEIPTIVALTTSMWTTRTTAMSSHILAAMNLVMRKRMMKTTSMMRMTTPVLDCTSTTRSPRAPSSQWTMYVRSTSNSTATITTTGTPTSRTAMWQGHDLMICPLSRRPFHHHDQSCISMFPAISTCDLLRQ